MLESIQYGGNDMKKTEVTCPYCEAEIPLEGDEKIGEEIYCSYCKMKLRLERRAGDLEAEGEEE